MPKIPQLQPQLKSPGGGGTRSSLPSIDVGGGRGRAVQRLGRRIQKAGQDVVGSVEAVDKADISAKMAQAQRELTTTLQDMVGSARPGQNVASDFADVYDKRMEEVGGSVISPGGSQRFRALNNGIRMNFMRTATASQAELDGQHVANTYIKSINELSGTIQEDPTQLQSGIMQMDVLLNDFTQQKAMSVSKINELKQDSESKLTMAQAQGYINMDPEIAQNILDSGVWKDLGADSLKKIQRDIRTEKTVLRLQASRLDAKARQERKDNAITVESDMMAKIVSNELSPKDVTDSVALDPFPEKQRALLNMIDKKNSGGARTDTALFNDLFLRIHLPDDDPEKLVDEDELVQHINRIDIVDLNKLRAEMQGAKTLEGKTIKAQKQAVLTRAKILSKSNPLIGLRDPEGDANLAAFNFEFAQAYLDGIKAGKTNDQLLNPRSKDYLGNLISKYQKTPVQLIQAIGDQMGKAAKKIQDEKKPEPTVRPKIIDGKKEPINDFFNRFMQEKAKKKK